MIKLSGIVFISMVVALILMSLRGQQPGDVTLMELQEIPDKGTNLRACEQDQDCIPIAESCCDCNQGGKRIAINKKYYKFSLDDRSDSCMLAVCQSAVSTHESCTSGKPVCVSGQCQMK